jgi:hypothetical protein
MAYWQTPLMPIFEHKNSCMKIMMIGLFALALAACNNTNKAFIEKVADADSIAINYYTGDGRMDTVVAVKILKDKQQIAQLSHFIGAKGTDNYKCGYDGSLHYFKRGVVLQDVDFRMNDVQCMHFSFLLNGQLYATSLTAEARQLLETVRK